jgi:dipeptidyl aminopeptidase/acylaminoacyl peptidase
LLGGVSNAAEPRFTLDDIYRTVGLSSPRISPDGKSLLFVRSHVNLDRDKREGELVLLDVTTRTERVLQTPSGVSDPAWSPDGTSITFVAEDDAHQSQVFLTWPQAGTPEQITHAKSGVDQYAWRPDGKAIAYVTFDPPPERTGIAKFQDAFRVTDNGYMHTGPFPPAHLWLATETQSQEVWSEHRLTAGPWSVAAGSAQSTISWSPDGKTLAYVRLPNALLGDADRSVVEKLDVANDASMGMSGRTRFEFNPRFSPNGAYIAYTYARDGDAMNEADIFLSRGRGPGADITRHSLDVNATNFAWSPDSHALFVIANAGTQSALWRLSVDGRAQRIPLGNVNVLGDLNGSIAPDGAFAFVGTTAQHPGEIYYRSAGGVLQRLTDYNAAIASKPLGKAATLNWTNDGFHEDGVLTYPVAYQPKKRYPLVLLIHGGPTSASLLSFDELAQLMAARGWFVLRPNYRGSDNLGNTYQHAIYIDATRGPGRDILAGVAAAQRTAPIDARKICVSGWSYGGMMTSWLITQDHRWACAVSGAAVNDLVYDYSLADDISADRESMPGSPFVGKNMALYRAVSPLTYYRNVRTPTLILSDMYDDRVPIAQSYAFYHALRDIGTPVEFYEWPVHGHFPSDPVRTADVYRYWIDWIAKHVK